MVHRCACVLEGPGRQFEKEEVASQTSFTDEDDEELVWSWAGRQRRGDSCKHVELLPCQTPDL